MTIEEMLRIKSNKGEEVSSSRIRNGHQLMQSYMEDKDPAVMEEIEDLAKDWYLHEIDREDLTQNEFYKICENDAFYKMLKQDRDDSINEVENCSDCRYFYEAIISASRDDYTIDVTGELLESYERAYFNLAMLTAQENKCMVDAILGSKSTTFAFVSNVCDAYKSVLDDESEEMYNWYLAIVEYLVTDWMEHYESNANSDIYTLDKQQAYTIFIDYMLIMGAVDFRMVDTINRLKPYVAYKCLEKSDAVIINKYAAELLVALEDSRLVSGVTALPSNVGEICTWNAFREYDMIKFMSQASLQMLNNVLSDKAGVLAYFLRKPKAMLNSFTEFTELRKKMVVNGFADVIVLDHAMQVRNRCFMANRH